MAHFHKYDVNKLDMQMKNKHQVLMEVIRIKNISNSDEIYEGLLLCKNNLMEENI
jgi:hypothetical protein